MTRQPRAILAAFIAALAAPPLARVCAAPPQQVVGDVAIWTDKTGDAELRRTDLGGDGVLAPAQALAPHDLRRLSISAWSPTDPVNDPYTGVVVPPAGADIFRLDLVVGGLAGPPGPIQLNGTPFDPFRFSDNPLYGFVELDADADPDTGGEDSSLAIFRYLGIVGHMSEAPSGVMAARMLRDLGQADANFASFPQFERSGAEMTLTFCGCFEPAVVSEGGDLDGRFEAGETWIVRGRFFERIRSAETISGATGGSFFGLYDPEVNLRFSHDVATDETTITLVFALTQQGAALLAGQPVQPLDLDPSNHASVSEMMADLIGGAPFAPVNDPNNAPMFVGWAGKQLSDGLDPTRWGATAVAGVSYATSVELSTYVWTDVGFDNVFGDVSGDGVVTSRDNSMLLNEIALRDGTSFDLDALVNGVWALKSWADNFTVFDLVFDGKIDEADQQRLAPLFTPGDVDGDRVTGPTDLLALLAAWGQVCQPLPATCLADLDADGVVGPSDLLILLSGFGLGP